MALNSPILQSRIFQEFLDTMCPFHVLLCLYSLWVRKIPWRREQQRTPVFLPGEFHGLRSLVGHSPGGHKESNTTKRLTLYVLSLIEII